MKDRRPSGKDRTRLSLTTRAAIAIAMALLSPLAARASATDAPKPQQDPAPPTGAADRFGAVEASGLRWLHLSSRRGDLPVPTTSRQQTAAVVADLDKDGLNDFVLAFREKGPALVWYRRTKTGWDRYVIEKDYLTIEAGGAVCDIDGDGYPDLVFGGDWQSNKVWWWRNPGKDWKPDVPWERHTIKKSGATQHHDQCIADFKGTGKPQLAYWNQGAKTLFVADIPANPREVEEWPAEQVFSGAAGENPGKYAEGMSAYDIDGDGRPELLAGNYMFKYVAQGKWSATKIGEIGGLIFAGRFIKEAKYPQIVIAPGDGSGPVKWYECKGRPLDSKSWIGHDLVGRTMIHPHSLQVADIDGDGNLDIFVAEMAKWSERKTEPDNPRAQAFIFYGDGKGNFRKTVFQTGMGFHEARVADLNGDGRLDILSKPYNWDAPRVDVWLNQGPARPTAKTVGARIGAGERSPGQREIVNAAMHRRGGDPWPRGLGHVVLGIPGSQQPEKAYHEPGGSFSPAVGSFGVSIWVRDAAGNLRTTSDAVPMEQVRQRFCWPDPKSIPAIITATPHYEAAWAYVAAGTATLQLDHRGNPQQRLELLVRSVGPAGGPIEKIAWAAGKLTINDRWTLTVAPEPEAVWVGHEGDSDWKSERLKAHTWKGDDGWGYARIELARGQTSKITLRDSAPSAPNPLRYPAVRSLLELDLPDPRFAECLDAQVAHLMMGLLDRRTPPGEPTNYPLAWQRDGAAVVAGLVRAGQLEVAKELVTYFAENDFFGGFGAEGDAPGQGLRVMEDVASRLHDPALDRWLWPHVERKADLILKMAAAKKPIHMPYAGPIVPAHRQRNDLDLVCEPARDGLIVGRMDFGRPASYITAVSYQGLRGAASLAARLKREGQSLRWRAAADRLQQAWLNAPQWQEDRTYISGLWPTWVAAADRGTFRTHLEQRSDPRRYLPWTYFSAAMTHQWLLLDQPDRVWENLQWFWKEQTSPGLYTWWEGSGEENTFNLWKDIRGWVKPPYVTPHYWTAGEILALQVEMLAYVDESGSEPGLVIGGGVPRSWVGKPMRVRGLPTSLGVVDWSWQDGKMQATVHGSRPKVRVGAAFGSAVQVSVSPPKPVADRS